MFLFSLLFAPAYLSAWHHPDCRSKNTRRPALFPPATSPRAVLAFAGTPCFCRYFPLFLSGGSCFSCRPCFSVTLPFPGCFPHPCRTPLQVARVVAGCPCPPSCFLPSSRLAYSVSPRPFCQNNTWAGAAGTVVRGNSAIMLTIWQGLPFGTTFVRSTGVTGSRNRRAKGTRQRKK